MLEENQQKRYAIIENEFGEQGIDNELILRPDETIVELNNGCLCCTLNDNLYDILNELFERRSEFDEIIIEATGVADPTGLAQPFISHPLVKKHFPLTSIICLVDAELVEDQLEETEEAISQITFSDMILINKIDLVSEDFVAVLEKRLQAMNPLAIILKGHKSQYPQIEYRGNNQKLEELFLNSKMELSPSNQSLRFPVKKPHSHHHHKHTEEVNSHTFIFDTPFNAQILSQQMSIYLSFQSKGLYRIKGLVWLENEEDQYILQSVGKRFNYQRKRAWRVQEKRQTILVFIGKNLPEQGLEKMLRRCISTPYLQTQ